MVPIQGELEQQLSMIESSLPKLPMQMDSEKPRSYLPKMPCRTAAYYPQAPMANADSLEYYLRLAPETLFFTFYYMEVCNHCVDQKSVNHFSGVACTTACGQGIEEALLAVPH